LISGILSSLGTGYFSLEYGADSLLARAEGATGSCPLSDDVMAALPQCQICKAICPFFLWTASVTFFHPWTYS